MIVSKYRGRRIFFFKSLMIHRWTWLDSPSRKSILNAGEHKQMFNNRTLRKDIQYLSHKLLFYVNNVRYALFFFHYYFRKYKITTA